jgi:hypothetical protein
LLCVLSASKLWRWGTKRVPLLPLAGHNSSAL